MKEGTHFVDNPIFLIIDQTESLDSGRDGQFLQKACGRRWETEEWNRGHFWYTQQVSSTLGFKFDFSQIG